MDLESGSEGKLFLVELPITSGRTQDRRLALLRAAHESFSAELRLILSISGAPVASDTNGESF